MSNPATAQTTHPAIGERERMMQLLGIPLPGQLPPMDQDPKRPAAAKTNPAKPGSWTDDQHRSYSRSNWGTWTNYDESLANGFVLPDPLVLNNGQPVKDADTWWKRRRPEILRAFQTEIYGKIPEHPALAFISWEVTVNDGDFQKIVGHIHNSADQPQHPEIRITLFLPEKPAGPVPLMMVMVPHAPDAAHPNAAVGAMLHAGWACALVETDAIQPDSSAGLSEGIIGLCAEGKPRKPDDWGVLSAWAWGMSQAMDYFQYSHAIDPHRIGIQGHSRWGKAALLTAALDQRFAIVFASCSGEGGAKLSRRNYGETVDNLCGGFH